jgi:hypothetical protein
MCMPFEMSPGTKGACIMRLYMHDRTLYSATKEQCPVVGMTGDA